MAEHLQNFVQTTVNMAAGISASATTLTVTDGSVFTASPNFRIQVDDEIMLVTGVSGNDLTVTRAPEGPAATVHRDGAGVFSALTEGALSTYVSENAGSGGIGDHGVRVKKSGNQGIASGGLVALTFDQETFDTDGYHDNSTNNSRLTVPSGQAGKYLIGAQCEFASGSGSFRQVALKVNGTTYIASQVQPPFSGGADGHQVNTLYDLAVGDYVEFFVNQATGSTLDVTGGNEYATNFWMQRVG